MSPRGRIGRFGRVPRRPDQWASPHDRARVRAAERLLAPLAPREEAWLGAHLEDCPACRTIAGAYAADRLALRALRDTAPEPPRDLWARTATRIEQESASRRASSIPPRSRRGGSLPALSALSGLAVVAVVVVATAVSGGFLGNGVAVSPSIALASQVAPQPTAIAVGAGKVHWLGVAENGVFAYNVADIDVVCPRDRQPDCAPFEDGHARRVSLAATPRFVFQSPIEAQAVVVGTDASGADAVIVVPLPTPDPTPAPTPEETLGASSPPNEPPPSSDATTPASDGTAPASDEPSASPTVTVTVLASDLPIDSAASVLPSGSDLVSPEPSAGAVAIITDVIVVGRTAAYAPDGSWFAFSARPADGTTGPDIYAWHVGDPQAQALTTDHASVFASWIGGSILGSRVSAVSNSPDPSPSVDGLVVEPLGDIPPVVDLGSADGLGQEGAGSPATDASQAIQAVIAAETVPQTFLLDPATGAEIPLGDAEWQPAVDPTGLAVVAWQGTVGPAGDGLTSAPATGNLVIHPFHGPLETDDPNPSGEASLSPEGSPSGSVAASVSPDPSASASASAEPQVVRDFPTQVVAAGPIADFDAGWDDTGSWLAIWIADPVNPGLGRLSLFHFDPFTGLLERPLGAPQDVTALQGFSIGLGRLAWVSPPGQGGEGSRIHIAAWTEDEVGAVESIPVEGAIVVQ